MGDKHDGLWRRRWSVLYGARARRRWGTSAMPGDFAEDTGGSAQTTRSASASTVGHCLCLHYWSLELVASIVTTRARSAAGGGLPSSLHLHLHRRPPELIPSPLSACRAHSASTSIVGTRATSQAVPWWLRAAMVRRRLGTRMAHGRLGVGIVRWRLGARAANMQRTPVDLVSMRERGRGIKNFASTLQAPTSTSTPSLTGGGEPRTAVGGSGGRVDDAIRLCLHHRSLELVAPTATT